MWTTEYVDLNSSLNEGKTCWTPPGHNPKQRPAYVGSVWMTHGKQCMSLINALNTKTDSLKLSLS
jgi:hypothetical protein